MHSVTQINCATDAPLNTATLTNASGGSGLQYDPTTDTDTYTMCGRPTRPGPAGTCQQFDLRLSDNTDHIDNFRFK